MIRIKHRWIPLLLVLALILTGCSPGPASPAPSKEISAAEEIGTAGEAATPAQPETEQKETGSPVGPETAGDPEEPSEMETEAAEDPEESAVRQESAADIASEAAGEDAEGQLIVTFLDVGQGDAILLSCDGHHMLVDGGSSSQSQKIYAVLKEEGIEELEYLVSTHPHQDHAGGLAAAFSAVSVRNVLSPVTSYDGKEFADLLRYAQKAGLMLTVPRADDSFRLGSAQVDVLGPVAEHADLNDMSIVLKVSLGDISFLLTGDAGAAEESEMIAAGSDLSATVLKAGHHGSERSTSEAFLKAVDPEVVVISCGKHNDYGHPHDALLERLAAAQADVVRTDMQGDITFVTDGQEAEIWVDRGADADTYQTYHDLYGLAPGETLAIADTAETAGDRSGTDRETEGRETESNKSDNDRPTESETKKAAPEYDYILNTNTHKFHYPNCSSVKKMKDKNKWEFHGTREEVIDMGYKPCGNCHP